MPGGGRRAGSRPQRQVASIYQSRDADDGAEPSVRRTRSRRARTREEPPPRTPSGDEDDDHQRGDEDDDHQRGVRTTTTSEGARTMVRRQVEGVPVPLVPAKSTCAGPLGSRLRRTRSSAR